MSDFFYATDSNIKRFRNLLETSVDETERRTIQRLLTEDGRAGAGVPCPVDIRSAGTSRHGRRCLPVEKQRSLVEAAKRGPQLWIAGCTICLIHSTRSYNLDDTLLRLALIRR